MGLNPFGNAVKNFRGKERFGDEGSFDGDGLRNVTSTQTGVAVQIGDRYAGFWETLSRRALSSASENMAAVGRGDVGRDGFKNASHQSSRLRRSFNNFIKMVGILGQKV